MRIRRRTIAVAALFLGASSVGIAGGCGEPPMEEGSHSPASGETTPAEAAGEPVGRGPEAPAAGGEEGSLRGVLPGLFGIMVGLQDDMARLDRGLWVESYDSIASAARAVADHPTVPPEEFRRISGVLGDAMASFRAMDVNVHDRAVELEAHARAGRLERVLATGAELRRGCVDCHSAYRTRLREALAAPASR